MSDSNILNEFSLASGAYASHRGKLMEHIQLYAEGKMTDEQILESLKEDRVRFQIYKR